MVNLFRRSRSQTSNRPTLVACVAGASVRVAGLARRRG